MSNDSDTLRTLPERDFRARAGLVAGVFCLICLGLAVRLLFLQVVGGGWYAQRALGQQLRDTVVSADRGRITSADGLLLAANSSCWTLRASPREMPEDRLTLAAKGLSDLLALDEKKLLEKFSDRRSNDCLLRYRVDRQTADAVRDFCEANGITGIRIQQDSKRWYPQGEFLASVLGFTNVDNAGVSGLELKYDDLLTGENGVVLTAVNAWGYTLEQSYETEIPPTEGDGLRLTIDTNIQHYLENALGYAVKEHHVAARAVGIVMDVNTGAVLAMSTTPSYDPNQPRVIADKAARETVEGLTGSERAAALQLAQQTQWRNKAVSDLYEPGSVFKLITCAAALDTGAIGKHSSFYCGDSISVAGTRFHCANHKRHGAQTVTQALENSCNQSFIQIGARLGKEAFCDYFAAFGLRAPHRHRPACRAEKEPLLHRRPDGAGGAGVLRLRAEQQDLLPRDGVGGLRRGQRRAADAALRRLGHPRPGGRGHRPPLPRLQAAGAERGDLPHHAGDDGGRRPLRRRTERPDRGLPGRRQERHQPEAGQRRRESPHRQLRGRGPHRRSPVPLPRLSR